jgi:hypothetical protein
LLRKKAVIKDLSGASRGRRAKKEPVDVLDLNIGGHGVGGMLCVIWHGCKSRQSDKVKQDGLTLEAGSGYR